MFQEINMSSKRGCLSWKDLTHRKLSHKPLFPEEFRGCGQWCGDGSGQLGLHLRNEWKWWWPRVTTSKFVSLAAFPFHGSEVCFTASMWLKTGGLRLDNYFPYCVGWCTAPGGLEEASGGKPVLDFLIRSRQTDQAAVSSGIQETDGWCFEKYGK